MNCVPRGVRCAPVAKGMGGATAVPYADSLCFVFPDPPVNYLSCPRNCLVRHPPPFDHRFAAPHPSRAAFRTYCPVRRPTAVSVEDAVKPSSARKTQIRHNKKTRQNKCPLQRFVQAGPSPERERASLLGRRDWRCRKWQRRPRMRRSACPSPCRETSTADSARRRRTVRPHIRPDLPVPGAPQARLIPLPHVVQATDIGGRDFTLVGDVRGGFRAKRLLMPPVLTTRARTTGTTG